MKTYSGFTTDTADSLLLDAGAFFKNFAVGTDTFDSAVAAGKLLGATQGGGEFKAVPSVRQIEVDGVKGRAKGLSVIDSWEVSIAANVIEVTKDTILAALAASESEETKVPSTSSANNYYKINAKNNLEQDDYINNITWVGTISGSDDPVIIQIYNAINEDGLTFSPSDKSEGVISMTFYGAYDQSKLDEPPFAIYYPIMA